MTRVAWEARLHVRRPGSPACPDHRIRVDAETTVMVPVGPDSRIVRQAAYQEAEDRFRRLGLGPVMDLPRARVDMEVFPISFSEKEITRAEAREIVSRGDVDLSGLNGEPWDLAALEDLIRDSDRILQVTGRELWILRGDIEFKVMVRDK